MSPKILVEVQDVLSDIVAMLPKMGHAAEDPLYRRHDVPTS